MRTTVILLGFCAAAWAAAVRPAKVSKRGIYDNGAYFGPYVTGSILGGHRVQPAAYSKQTIHTTGPSNYYNPRYNPRSHFSPYVLSDSYKELDAFFLRGQEDNYKFRPADDEPWSIRNTASGYDYPKPLGHQFFEDPVPSFFNFVVPPAITPFVKTNPGNPPDRRIVTPYNSGHFFKHPSHAGPPAAGLVIQLPIPMARRTRIVVPQHGAVALGSGGLGYSSLSGGRIALGSGSISFANLAVARAQPLPPRPPYVPSLPLRPARPKTGAPPPTAKPARPARPTVTAAQPKPAAVAFPFSFPAGFSNLRGAAPAGGQTSSNSLTVFPQPNDGLDGGPSSIK